MDQKSAPAPAPAPAARELVQCLAPCNSLNSDQTFLSKQTVVTGTAATTAVASAGTVGASPTPTPQFRLQIASDLHLEHLRDRKQLFELITPSAPYLALLGDIGCVATADGFDLYRDFVLHVASQFDAVFIIAGNHEYYNAAGGAAGAGGAGGGGGRTAAVPCTIPEIDSKIGKLCSAKSNIHYLNRASISIGGVRVVGATLWSHVPLYAVEEVEAGISDYARIFVPEEFATHPLIG